MALMPGSNPLFGLNTLGGALSLETKNGARDPGTSMQAIYGSHTRRRGRVRARRVTGGGALHWYVAGNLFDEQGWREDSPSSVGAVVRQAWLAADADRREPQRRFCRHTLNGNGLQESGFLDRDYASVYTKPDETDNRSTFLNLSRRHSPRGRADAFRHGVLPPHPHEHAQRRHQRGFARSGALSAGCRRARRPGRRRYTGVPVSGETAVEHAIPEPGGASATGCYLDEPGEKCNGLINRGEIVSTMAAPRPDRRSARRGAVISSPSAARTTTARRTSCSPRSSDISIPIAASRARGVRRRRHRRDRHGEPFDTRVDLDGQTRTFSVYATDTLRWREGWHLTLSGRFNRTVVENHRPHHARRRTGSLDRHTYVQPLQPRGGSDHRSAAARQRLRRLQRRQPRGDVDRAWLRRSRIAVQAAQRDGRRSAARSGHDADD